MINYELAKELKDAGFPQLRRRGLFLHAPECGSREVFMCDSIYAPSLEELIEACGNDFARLYRGVGALNKELPNGWCAEDYANFHRQGSTPTEAVARLWLALNKPKLTNSL